MTEYFDDLLAIILDGERELNPSRLSELSDPSRANLAAFRRAWFEAPSERRAEISHKLNQLAEQNIELLFERINLVLLEDPEPQVRQQAIANLWESEGKGLALKLVKLTRHDPDEAVRLRAVKALGRFIYLGELDKIPATVRQEIEDVLLHFIEEPESDLLRLQALESLGYSSKVNLSEHIQTAYQADDEGALRASLVAMGRTADPAYREQIEAHLSHPSPEIRAEAARAIGEIQSRKSTELLFDLMDDPKQAVRQAAIWSLGQLGGDQAREALEGLEPDSSSDQAVIEEALEHLAFMESTPDLMMFDLSPEDD